MDGPEKDYAKPGDTIEMVKGHENEGDQFLVLKNGKGIDHLLDHGDAHVRWHNGQLYYMAHYTYKVIKVVGEINSDERQCVECEEDRYYCPDCNVPCIPSKTVRNQDDCPKCGVVALHFSIC